MKQQIMDKRAEILLEVFQIKFKKSKDWSEPRCDTTWGTKTKHGAIETIRRIMFDVD